MDQPDEHSPRYPQQRPARLGPWLVMLLSALIGSTAMLAFVVFLFTGPWKVVQLFSDTPTVLAFDAALSLLFFAQHSGMIRASFKRRSARLIPEHYHGAVFAIASGICLFCVVHFWQAAEQDIITVQGDARLVLRALFLAAVAGIAWSALTLHSLDSFGLRAIRDHLYGRRAPQTDIMEQGPYRWVRHPQYFCVLVMIWTSPDLSADRLLFNVIWSTWVVVGTLLEERDLLLSFGNQYRDYRRRVSMLVPLPRKT